MVRLQIAPGVTHWRERLDRAAQSALLNDVLARVELAPFYRPVMPKTAAPFSVLETNFGTLGWISDRSGYRYAKTHPATGQAWPDIPHALLALWNEMAQYEAPPQCCLVNLYLGNAKMGLHQDRDEEARDAPVLSVSLGEAALFRIGGDRDKRKTASVKLLSGDVVMFAGPARLAYHGIDRVIAGSSTLVPGGGRINLTLRRVTSPNKKTPGQGG
jgi:alkylated DNA repair protein (DNA oxidative demethylase)